MSDDALALDVLKCLLKIKYVCVHNLKMPIWPLI